MPRTAKTPKVEIDPDHKLTTRELILKIMPEGLVDDSQHQVPRSPRRRN